MLVSAKEMLEKARDGKYAVGQFNINNNLNILILFFKFALFDTIFFAFY